MSVGKYSPTVSAWYRKDQNWHDRHCIDDNWVDQDGYDSYGYHTISKKDRAGYTESDYLLNGKWINSGTDYEDYVYDLYERVEHDWCHKPFPWEITATPNQTLYRVIHKADNQLLVFDHVKQAAAYMWGKDPTNLVVIKSDHKGDRIVCVPDSTSDVNVNQIVLAQA